MTTETLSGHLLENTAPEKLVQKTSYFQTILDLLSSPRIFFTDLPQETGYKKSLTFLVISGVFWASLRYTYFSDHSFFQAITLIVNALGMPFILAAFSFMVMGLFFGRLTTYKHLAIVYAYATGVTMMLSWLPATEIFTEPWRFMLVAVGLVKWCSLKWIQAIVVICLGVFIMLALLASMTPIIYQLKILFG